MKREHWNVCSALVTQAVTVICGLLGPRLLMQTYGGEAYGATVAIAQFLSCINLLESGMGAVARAELYVPLDKGDICGIGEVYGSIQRFFRGLGIVFLVYTLALALGFHDIAAVTIWERTVTFSLVLVMGISTAIQYIGGVSDVILLNADRRYYVGQLSYAFCTLFNTIALFLLTKMGCSLLSVKVAGSIIFLLRPILLRFWRKRIFPSLPCKSYRSLPQSRYGFGQHIAYFLHRNTDILLLTLFGDLKLTAVYSLYLLVCGNLRNLCISFSAGMEAELGKCYAEGQALRESYFRYEKRMRKISFALFSIASALILPFIGLYTNGLEDEGYRQPLFAALFLLAEMQNCLLQPCYALPLAANRFKETRFAAYGEAALNIGVSCLLMYIWEPLPAVAAGTIVAQSVRALWLRKYIRKNFFSMDSLWKSWLPWLLTAAFVVVELPINSWIQWILWGSVLTGIAACLLLGKEIWSFAERRWKR